MDINHNAEYTAAFNRYCEVAEMVAGFKRFHLTPKRIAQQIHAAVWAKHNAPK